MLLQAPAVIEPAWAIRLVQGVEFRHKLGICDRPFARSLSRHGVCWIRTSAGMPWKLDLTSPTHRWIVYGKYEGRPISVRRLSDAMRDRGVVKVDLWKLDVEGFELEALSSGEELLARRCIGAIYAEHAFGHGAQIRAYPAALGYLCHLFDSAGRLHVPSALPPRINGLFLPR